MADSSNWRAPRATPRDTDRPSTSTSSSTQRRGQPKDAGEPRLWTRQPIRRLAERPRHEDVQIHRPEPQQDDAAAAQAIAEGRRIYLGNLAYSVRPTDIKELVHSWNAGPLENLHVSMDPISGRNPGYCFLEFQTREAADNAMAVLNGKSLYHRELKCRPCVPKGNNRRPTGREGAPRTSSGQGFNRWGDWDASEETKDGPRAALAYYEDDIHSGRAGKELHVGGLPRMLDQAMNEEEIRGIFEGFGVELVGKRISPSEKAASSGGSRHNHCFVTFTTHDEAKAALKAKNRSMYRGAPLKVSMARDERLQWSG